MFPPIIMPQDLQFLVTLQLAIMEDHEFSDSNPAGIGKVSLIRLPTFTHGFNSNIRFIWLQIQSRVSSSVTVSAPVNPKIAPPGRYLIHVLNSTGVPSKAKVIEFPGTSSGGGGGAYITISLSLVITAT